MWQFAHSRVIGFTEKPMKATISMDPASTFLAHGLSNPTNTRLLYKSGDLDVISAKMTLSE